MCCLSGCRNPTRLKVAHLHNSLLRASCLFLHTYQDDKGSSTKEKKEKVKKVAKKSKPNKAKKPTNKSAAALVSGSAALDALAGGEESSVPAFPLAPVRGKHFEAQEFNDADFLSS
jgi:hypothetical protein